jgi:hypothetical protein
MPIFKLPLSGNVVQTISPWVAFMSPMGSQLGLINFTIIGSIGAGAGRLTPVVATSAGSPGEFQ